MSHAIERLNPSTMPDAGSIGYSQMSIVEPGRLVFISGQVAIPAGGGPIPTDLAAQTAVAADNARAALVAIGAAPSDIAIARVYVTDLTPERLEAMMPPLLVLFDGSRPSLTGVGVAALAGPDFQVEIELTVRLP